MAEPTYRSLARRALFVARSHATPWLRAAADFAVRCGQVACILAIGAAFGVQIGAMRANERHAESLRRIIPVAEAALVAHERAMEATTDTLEMLEVDGP